MSNFFVDILVQNLTPKGHFEIHKLTFSKQKLYFSEPTYQAYYLLNIYLNGRIQILTTTNLHHYFFRVLAQIREESAINQAGHHLESSLLCSELGDERTLHNAMKENKVSYELWS